MYKIIFKGKDLEPLTVDDQNGKRVWDIWLTNKATKLVLQNTAFNTTDIKTISKMAKTKAEKSSFDAHQAKVNAEYHNFRTKMLSLPIEQRAKMLRIAKMVHQALTGTELPDDIKPQVEERQLAYFREHPKCVYANPSCYRDLIAVDEKRKKDGNFNPASNTVGRSALRMIEEIIRTDLQYSAR